MDTFIKFIGSPFDIGDLQGKMYKNNGMDLSRLIIDNEIFDKQYAIYQKYYPEMIEEIKGIAHGGGFDEKQSLWYFMGCSYIKGKKDGKNQYHRTADPPLSKTVHSKGCSIFSLETKKGTYLGRNYDWTQKMEDYVTVFTQETPKNPKRYPFVAVTDMGCEEPFIDPRYHTYSGADFINNKLLFIGYTFFFCDLWNFGLHPTDFMKLVAETCQTLEEVVELVNKVPVLIPKNFFVMERTGRCLCIEHSTRDFKILYPQNGMLVQTNHAIHPELAKVDEVLKVVPGHDTFVRLEEIYMQLRDYQYHKNFDFTCIKSIMRDPSSFVFPQQEYNKTIWTLEMCYPEKRIDVIYYRDGKEKRANLFDIVKTLS